VASQPPAEILTVGHGARSIETFLELLREAGIERVVDVRTAPGSRRHPQFGRDALAEALAQEGIAYEWRGRDLGGFRKPAPDSPHTALRNDSFRGYADHMAGDAFREGLAWLVRTSRERRTAVMCAESVWWRCHRRMIADALTVAGVPVTHLMDGEPRKHELHPNARVDQAGRLVYDVGVQPELSEA
jgi:uncharacterized protein (DUF488 family)